jgi:2-oxoglutarate ferredoxin oxidoreductase subunit gamma
VQRGAADRKLLIDAELVRPKHDGKNVFRIHATRFAEDLGNRIVANVVMLGFFTCVTGIVSVEAMKKAIPESVPKRYLNLNLKAFDKGYAYGEEISSR